MSGTTRALDFCRSVRLGMSLPGGVRGGLEVRATDERATGLPAFRKKELVLLGWPYCRSLAAPTSNAASTAGGNA